MGLNKAFIDVDGAPLVARSLAALVALDVREVLIGGTAPGVVDLSTRLLAGTGIAMRPVPDLVPLGGPLQALIACLAASAERTTVVLACDMPSVDPAQLAEQLAEVDRVADLDASIAVAAGRFHPLHGVYKRRCLVPFIHAWRSGSQSLHAAIQTINVAQYMAPDSLTVQNWNEPADIPS